MAAKVSQPDPWGVHLLRPTGISVRFARHVAERSHTGRQSSRRLAFVEHLEPPLGPVPVGGLEGPRGSERNPHAGR
jgi:hypothetical protein